MALALLYHAFLAATAHRFELEVQVSLLPPANVVCEGYAFTHVCHSVHRGEGRAWLPGGACMVAGGGVHGWGACVPGGGMRGEGGACMAKGGVHGKRGACMVKEGCVRDEGGACVAKGGHAWRRGACMAKGGACVVCTHPPQDTAGHCASGTHPTGMHSCFE